MTLIPALVAGIIVIVGWRVVESFARQRERRSDMREMVKSFSSAVDDIVENARALYQLNGNDTRARSLASLVRAKIGILPQILVIMREAGLAITADDELRVFRQTVTGGNFDGSGRTALDPNDNFLDSITVSGYDLTRAVQIGLFRSFISPKRTHWYNRISIKFMPQGL